MMSIEFNINKKLKIEIDFDFFTLPKEVHISCLQYIKPNEVAQFSLASKRCKALADEPSLWLLFCRQIDLELLPSQPPKEKFKAAFLKGEYHLRLFMKQMNFKEHLGDEICQALCSLEIWQKTIETFCANPDPYCFPFAQFQDYAVADNRDHLFAKVQDQEFFIIFINKDRVESKVYRILNSFNSNPINTTDELITWHNIAPKNSEEFLYYEYRCLDRYRETFKYCSYIYSPYSEVNRTNIARCWKQLKDTLSKFLLKNS